MLGFGEQLRSFATLWVVVIPGVLFLLTSFAEYLVKLHISFRDNPELLSSSEAKWFLWPAFWTNAVLKNLFGPRGKTIKDLFTYRSALATLAISLTANIICVIIVIAYAPDNYFTEDLNGRRTLALSYMVFIVFNYFGDLLSINMTRYVLSKITEFNSKSIFYLVLDFVFAILVYPLMLLPALAAIYYCSTTGANINELINMGLLGGAIIPFFLFEFMFTGMPMQYELFAFVAIFSVTIPTVTYVVLTILLIAFAPFKIIVPNTLGNILKRRLDIVLHYLEIISKMLSFWLVVGTVLVGFFA